MRSIRGAQRALRGLRNEARQSRRVALQDLEAGDEAHDAQELAIQPRSQLSIVTITRERHALLREQAELGAPSPSRAWLAQPCRNESILNRRREAFEEFLSFPTPYLQRP